MGSVAMYGKLRAEYTSISTLHMGTYAHITRYTAYIITDVVCRGQQASGRRPSTSSVHPLAVVSLVLGPTSRLELWQGRRDDEVLVTLGVPMRHLKCTKHRRYWGGSTNVQLLLLWH